MQSLGRGSNISWIVSVRQHLIYLPAILCTGVDGGVFIEALDFIVVRGIYPDFGPEGGGVSVEGGLRCGGAAG
jgi:hypothetical protein